MWRVVTLIVLTYQDALVQFCLLFYGLIKFHHFRPQLASNQIPMSLYALPAFILLFVIIISLANDVVLLSFGLRDNVSYAWQIVVLHFLFVWVESWTWAALYIRPSLLKQLQCLERLTRQRTSPLSSRIRTNNTTTFSNTHPTYESAPESESCLSLSFWFPCLSKPASTLTSTSASPRSQNHSLQQQQQQHQQQYQASRSRSSRYREAKSQDRIDALCVLGIVSVVCILFSWLETTVTSPSLPQLASRVSIGVLAICGYGSLVIRSWYELSTVNTVDKLWMLLKESPPPPQATSMAITASYASRQSSSSATSSLGGMVSSIVFQNTAWNLLLFIIKGGLLLTACSITLVYALPAETDDLDTSVKAEGRLVLIVLNYVFRWFCEAWSLINLRECLKSYAQLQPLVALENISSSLRPVNPTMDERGLIPLNIPNMPSSQGLRKSEATDGANIGVTFISGVETYVDDTTSAGAAAVAAASSSRPTLTKITAAVLPVTEQSLSVTGENASTDGTVHSLKPSERRLLAELNKIFPPPLPSPSSPTINTTNANVSGILSKHERVSSIDSLMLTTTDRKLSEATTLKSDSITADSPDVASISGVGGGGKRSQWMFNLPSITSPVLTSTSPGSFTGTTMLNTATGFNTGGVSAGGLESREYPFPKITMGGSKDDDYYPTTSAFSFSPSPPPRHAKSWSFLKNQQQQQQPGQQQDGGLQSSLTSPKFRINVGSKLDLADFGTGLKEEDEDHEEEKT